MFLCSNFSEFYMACTKRCIIYILLYLDFEKMFVRIYCPTEEFSFTKNVRFLKFQWENIINKLQFCYLKNKVLLLKKSNIQNI